MANARILRFLHFPSSMPHPNRSLFWRTPHSSLIPSESFALITDELVGEACRTSNIPVALCQRLVSQTGNSVCSTGSLKVYVNTVATNRIILRWMRVPSVEGTWIYLGASSVWKRDRLRSIDPPWRALCYTYSYSTNTRHSMRKVYLGCVSQSSDVAVS